MPSTEETFRATIAAILSRTRERQSDVAAAIGQTPTKFSRKRTGDVRLTFDDADALAAHWQMPVLDLLAGPTHAVTKLPAALTTGARQPTLDVAASAPASRRRKAPAAPPAPSEAARPIPPDTSPAADLRAIEQHLTAAPDTPELQPAGNEPAPPPVTLTPDADADGKMIRGPLEPCVLCDRPVSLRAGGRPQHAYGLCGPAEAAPAEAAPAEAAPAEAAPAEAAPAEAAPAEAAPAEAAPAEAAPAEAAPAEAAPAEAAPAASPADVVHGPRRTPGYAPDSLVSTITDRVQEAIRDAEGDIEEAQKALIKTAIPDVMELFRRSRVGGRYEHSEFPPTDDVLKKKSQKGADQIWEGRPKWRNEKLFKSPDPLQVSVLDMNAAYLSGMKCWLPIGRLIEDTSGVHNPKKSGVHLIAPPEWDNADLPNPMGSRKEPGDVWVPEELLRTLIWAADQGLCEHPVIRKSLVSGATENLLEKLRRALVQARETAIEEGNEIAVEYVKAMYSKFVSTIGESSANRDLRRPDWMHNIRAKATGNLIRKADKARSCGLLVVQVSGTDELHVVGDWRNAVLANGKPAFPEGRGLNEVKEKKDHAYTIGGGK